MGRDERVLKKRGKFLIRYGRLAKVAGVDSRGRGGQRDPRATRMGEWNKNADTNLKREERLRSEKGEGNARAVTHGESKSL